jgi:DNA-directed RNA polymerase subunit M/transcription elongation factor TFIIS
MDYRQQARQCLMEYVPEGIAAGIEVGIYRYATDKAIDYQIDIDFTDINFRRTYANKLLGIVVNLRSDSYVHNPRFLERIVGGEIEPESVARMRPHEICPEKWEDVIQMTTKLAELSEQGGGRTTDSYTCARCHRNKCTYFDMQSRSMDEPMTRYFRCCHCGHQWSMN